MRIVRELLRTGVRELARLKSGVLAAGLGIGWALAGCQATIPGLDEVGRSPTAQLHEGWNAIAPGGETRCSDGSTYQFWVRRGDPKKLLFYLQGGGACWSRETCDTQMSPTYTVNLDGFDPHTLGGIFDASNADNPVRDYTKVFVPYCSGDVHLGAKDQVYAPATPEQAPLTIYHRGLKNAGAALAWTYANITSPRTVFVAGSSAGAVPSPYYAMKLKERYPKTRVVQLGDGAGGYTRRGTDVLPYEQWGSLPVLNAEPAFADLTSEIFRFEDMYIRAARQQPNVVYARYDAAEDSVQRQFLNLMGVDKPRLLPRLDASASAIDAALTGPFHSYVAGGESHTMLRHDRFYRFSTGGVRLRDWVAALVDGETVANVRCDDCRLPEFAGTSTPPALRDLWLSWEDEAQAVEPLQIFDNLYYVGIGWVSAYVLKTSNGLILIDALYGKWVNRLYANMRALGLDPAAIKYVIATHGHFDHAAGAADVQRRYGARVVMAAEDWALAEAPADHPLFAMTPPRRDIVAEDGMVVTLGDTRVHLYKTPGHTEGVLSLRYEVRATPEKFRPTPPSVSA